MVMMLVVTVNVICIWCVLCLFYTNMFLRMFNMVLVLVMTYYSLMLVMAVHMVLMCYGC